MKMRALDSFYSSETRQVAAGGEFEIESESRAKEFVARGLAEFVDAPTGEGGDPDAVDDLVGKSAAELRAIAAAETIDLGQATKKADLITAIRAARASRAD